MSWNEFSDVVENLHCRMHLWFCATGYITCIGGSRSDAIAHPEGIYPNVTEQELQNCMFTDFAFYEQAKAPFFWGFHTYLDLLFERWQQIHGFGEACELDQAMSAFTSSGTWDTLAPGHPDACLSQMTIERAEYSNRDMCKPASELGYR